MVSLSFGLAGLLEGVILACEIFGILFMISWLSPS